MNRDQLAKNIGGRLRLQPEPRGCHGSIINGDWILEAVAPKGVELRHTYSGIAVRLNDDHTHNFVTDRSGMSDGFLVLHVNVRQDREGRFTVGPIVPKERGAVG